jgi:hypothetical protein
MATRIFFAIMGCTFRMYTKIIELALSVYDLLYANPLIYPTPPLTNVQLKVLIDAAVEAVAKAVGGGRLAIIDRNDKVKLLFYALINQLLPYVNGLWRGNQPNLALSGFPLSKEPEPIGAPLVPVIKRVEKGTGPNTVKIVLEKRTGSVSQRKARLIYFVFKCSDAEGTNLQLVYTTSSAHDLIVQNVPRGDDSYYTVSARHGKNGTELATKVRFLMH